jgi:sigma-B regulation protein RsbU (phosphoserine phosphatase)
MPVGLMETADFEVRQAALTAGDKILLYSDGVTESQNPEGEFFGRQRLRQVIAAHQPESSRELRDAVAAAIAAFTEGAPQADDITLLVLEYRGE